MIAYFPVTVNLKATFGIVLSCILQGQRGGGPAGPLLLGILIEGDASAKFEKFLYTNRFSCAILYRVDVPAAWYRAPGAVPPGVFSRR